MGNKNAYAKAKRRNQRRVEKTTTTEPPIESTFDENKLPHILQQAKSHQSLVSPPTVLALQRLMGNKSVVQLMHQTLQRTPAEKSTKQTAVDKPTIQQHYAPALQLKHIPIPEVVQNFKNQVTPSNEPPSSPTLVETGQFYWTKQISHKMLQYLDALEYLHVNDNWLSLIDWIKNVVNLWPHDSANFWGIQLRNYVQLIRKLAAEGSPSHQEMLPFLYLLNRLIRASAPDGKTLYYSLWRELNQTDQIPDLRDYMNLATLERIWTWENQACGYTGTNVVSRYTKKGGAKKANSSAKRDPTTSFGATFATSGKRDMRKTLNDLRVGDLLNQRGVAAAIPKMQAALDDGWVLHARVLSGIDYAAGEYAEEYDKQAAKGKPPKQPQALGEPHEEHSIMIIGYDGVEFVFWDPDSASSHRHGDGFGSLFYYDDRLTTAETTFKLLVGDDGDHADGEHRYQIIKIASE